MLFRKKTFSFIAKNTEKVGGCTFLVSNKGSNANKQQGVALITAMIITTIAVSLAGTVMYRQQLQIRLSSNISHLEQAYMYVHGMEDWAGTILTKDFEDHKEYTSLEDDWYAGGKLITFPIDGGTLNGQLVDLQGRINVNSLNRPPPLKPAPVPTGQAPLPKKPDIANINRLRLQNLIDKIDPDQEMGPVENFTDTLKDWIDDDQENGNHQDLEYKIVYGEGAESDYYQSLEVPYFSANTEMVSTTELRLLKDMNKKVYAALQKDVATLPIKDAKGKESDTKLNVNTASSNVLASLGLTPDVVEKIIEERKIQPFEKVENFLDFIRSDVADTEEFKEDIDVKSNYFLLKGRVTIINASIPVNSILHRDGKTGKISVIMRDFSIQ